LPVGPSRTWPATPSSPLLVLGVGALLGFRFHNGFGPGVAAYCLVLAFSYAMSWEMAWIGMKAKDAETAQIAAFLPVFIMVFAGAGFVPIHDMPGWLQAFAHVQPISVTINTVRALTQGGAIYHNLWQSVAWIVGLLAVFMPLAVAEYRKV
jgi:ABC-2 type transport system permease protein/oleandomycin transport system permease protein